MSYDLFFTARREDSQVTVEALQAFFRQRNKYQVSDEQAIYENEDTGVVFIFDLNAPEGEAEDGESVSLNLNYWRPHVFALEAEPEISALVREFDFVVGDPQGEMEDGEYNRDAFLRGWNDGNAFAYRSFLSNPDFDDQFFTAPAARIEAAWRWNLSKDQLQARLGEEVFVPTIFWLPNGKSAVTTIVWGDGMPIALPEVDTVLVAREEFAPKKLFRKQPDSSLARWDEIEPLVAEFSIESAELPYRLLRYTEIPPHIVEFIKSRNPTTGEMLPFERVLDLELVEKARTK